MLHVLGDQTGTKLSLLKWTWFRRQSSSATKMIWNYWDADMERACELIDETNWDTVFSKAVMLTVVR